MIAIIVSVLLVTGIVTACTTTDALGNRVNEQIYISYSTSIFMEIEKADVSVGISPDNKVYIRYYDNDLHAYEIKQSNDELVLK